MNRLLNDEKFPFGEMKGKKIKDLEDDFVRRFIKSNAYRKNKKLRYILIQYHKDTIKDKDGGGKRRRKKRTIKKTKKNQKHTLHYFSADWCGFCQKFNKTWNQLIKYKDLTKTVNLKKTIIDDENEHLLSHYNIVSFPTLLLIKRNGERVYYSSDSRTKEELHKFIQDNL